MEQRQVPSGPYVQPMLAARFCRRQREQRRHRRRCSCRTPDRARCSELSEHAAASFIHLVCRETSVLLFPQRYRRQTSPPLQCLARRSGDPGRDAHPVAGGRRKDVFVNVRIYSDGKLRLWVTARHAKYPTTVGYHAEIAPKPGRRLSAALGGAINCSGRVTLLVHWAGMLQWGGVVDPKSHWRKSATAHTATIASYRDPRSLAVAAAPRSTKNRASLSRRQLMARCRGVSPLLSRASIAAPQSSNARAIST